MGPQRKAQLRAIVRDYLKAGAGVENLMDILDRMLEAGETTEAELNAEFGREGFLKTIIRPATREKNRETGRDIYVPTETGGSVQLELASVGQLTWVYWVRKRHWEDTGIRLGDLRQYIIDLHGVDPETLPDPGATEEE